MTGIMDILNKKSGVLGLSGISSDFRDLDAAGKEGNQRALTAQQVFHYRILKYIGAYVAAMNGVDCICFTAGIGENSGQIRKQICENLTYLGIWIDDNANSKRGEEVVISTPDSKVKIIVIPTNEELAIARETAALLNNTK